ncbi:hypothetical protein [Streptomyces sp. M2CJ-2]|uniref:hypothetical protein n=1 Tax=Streptomyces sp. M2CJ-2 TaxID=2803948 RepID=UPI001F482AB2|nr:hypothetical protein [Streptomyces sp. M2CJ-2]
MSFQQPSSFPQPGPGAQGPFGLGAPTGPVRPPKQRGPWLKYGAVALVSLFIGVGIGSSGDGSAASENAAADTKSGPRPTATVTETAEADGGGAKPAPTVTETETVTAKPKKTKEPGPATSFSGEGEYVVGEDIKAGTYKTAGADGDFGCYWERAKDASGEFGSIIANNNLNGPGRVTLNTGEYFKTNRCQEWKRVG